VVRGDYAMVCGFWRGYPRGWRILAVRAFGDFFGGFFVERWGHASEGFCGV